MPEANAASDGKRKFTQHMTMHLNGGSKFSELHYRVHADGVATNIYRFKRTDGSPKYLITDDVFVCGDDRFDVLASEGVGLTDWLEAHAKGIQLAT
jgi:hypothetical protein